MQRNALIEEMILDMLADGEAAEEICKNDWAPSERTLRRWQRDDVAFAAAVARARAEGLERALLKSEKRFHDLEAKAARGEPVTYNDIALAKAAHDAIKWRVSRLLPQYSDRLIVDQTTRTVEPDAINPTEAAEAYSDIMRGRSSLH